MGGYSLAFGRSGMVNFSTSLRPGDLWRRFVGPLSVGVLGMVSRMTVRPRWTGPPYAILAFGWRRDGSWEEEMSM